MAPMAKKKALSRSSSATVAAQPPSDLFAVEFAKLNPKQRLAVETVEGPVMVVAGPGTGKTQVVALRVANILKRMQMRPGNILCLTFSNSGATAMRERLRSLIGADAYGVKVSTIHAFAQSIIEDHADVFEDWSAREQISDVQKVREMNTIIDQILPQAVLLNQKSPYEKVFDLFARISDVKREGKTIEDLERAADAYEEVMSKKSKPGTKVHEKNILAAKKFRDFVEIFRRYQAMLRETHRYDYDDMILHVIDAFENNDWLLAGLQERFQYVLVDEFQDTNGAQYRLIELLTTYKELPHEPNFFVVGDDDQAIYRFQGANLRNMLSFHERFPKAPVIALTTSYRSTQAILDAAGSLIEKNEERLVGRIPGLEKILKAQTKDAGAPPTLLRAASDTAEPWLIADLVEERIKQGIAPEEIAILTQTNSELFPLYDVLRARGIPVLLRGKDDLLSHSLVLQAITILRAIQKPRDGALMASALACDCFQVHPVDIARLNFLAREGKTRLFDLFSNLPPSDALPLQDADRLRNAIHLLVDFHQKIESRTALETVEHVLRGSGLIPAPADIRDSDPRDLAAVEAFFEYVRAQCLEKRTCTLRELLSDIDIYADPTYAPVRLTYELPHLTTTGVRLMTAHQSKGLEFHTVILTQFRDGHWDKRRRPFGISIPEDLLFGWEKDQKTFEQNQDERRVAFVAMTRAKRELIMTCPQEMSVGVKARALSPSGFFAEMGRLPEQAGALRDPATASLLLFARPKPLDDALKGYIEERLKTFMLSATSLNRFLRDPQQFLLVDLLGQPEHFDESTVRRLGYGNAVHWALRQWAVARKDGKNYGIDDFRDAFAWHLRERTALTDNQRNDLIALGNESLPRYYEQRLHGATPFIHAIEHEYRTHLPGSILVPIKGKIDRIDLASKDSGTAIVIDYKAGKGKTESEIRGGIDPGLISRTDEGEHFRQLTFYSVLLCQAEPLLQPREFALEYIGERGEHPVTRSFVITDAERDHLRRLLKDVWHKIVSLDFSAID